MKSKEKRLHVLLNYGIARFLNLYSCESDLNPDMTKIS